MFIIPYEKECGERWGLRGDDLLGLVILAWNEYGVGECRALFEWAWEHQDEVTAAQVLQKLKGL